MKKLILFLSFVLLSVVSQAQSRAYDEGSHIFSAGYGIPNLLSVRFNITGGGTGFNEAPIGPIYLRYEYIASRLISVGFQLAYNRTDINYSIDYIDNNNQMMTGTEGCTITNLSAYTTVDFYWLRTGRVAFYSGLGIGYNDFKYSEYSDDPNFDTSSFGRNIGNTIPIGGQMTAVGIKVDVSNGLGFYSSIGVGKSLFDLGICYGFGGTQSRSAR